MPDSLSESDLQMSAKALPLGADEGSSANTSVAQTVVVPFDTSIINANNGLFADNWETAADALLLQPDPAKLSATVVPIHNTTELPKHKTSTWDDEDLPETCHAPGKIATSLAQKAIENPTTQEKITSMAKPTRKQHSEPNANKQRSPKCQRPHG